MKKESEITLKVSLAWKRTTVFLKLVRHKLGNGHLHGTWDQYLFPIVAHYRDTENNLMSKLNTDERGGDRHSEAAKAARTQKKFVADPLGFNKYRYDDQIREIIKNIDDKAQSEKIFQKEEKTI